MCSELNTLYFFTSSKKNPLILSTSTAFVVAVAVCLFDRSHDEIKGAEGGHCDLMNGCIKILKKVNNAHRVEYESFIHKIAI